MPLELGPVLRYESRRVARRKGWYVLRAVFVLAVGSELAFFHEVFLWNVRFGTPPAVVKQFLAPTLASFLVTLHLIIAFLIAPIEAASAFNRVQIRPMLSILLVTQTSPRRIVWETFAACLIPATWLWLSSIPVVAIVISWWGVDPELIAIIEQVTVGSILVSVAAAVAISLWSKQVFMSLVALYRCREPGCWGRFICMIRRLSGLHGWPARIPSCCLRDERVEPARPRSPMPPISWAGRFWPPSSCSKSRSRRFAASSSGRIGRGRGR